MTSNCIIFHVVISLTRLDEHPFIYICVSFLISLETIPGSGIAGSKVYDFRLLVIAVKFLRNTSYEDLKGLPESFLSLFLPRRPTAALPFADLHLAVLSHEGDAAVAVGPLTSKSPRTDRLISAPSEVVIDLIPQGEKEIDLLGSELLPAGCGSQTLWSSSPLAQDFGSGQMRLSSPIPSGPHSEPVIFPRTFISHFSFSTSSETPA